MKILRTRVLRPLSRKDSSPYKIDTSDVTANDTLIVNITHESEPLELMFQFDGATIAGKSSIHFKAEKQNGQWKINWSAIAPSSNTQLKSEATVKPVIKFIEGKLIKNSFPPIANENSYILILGTMPGDRSLEMNEYYAHKRNQFWKIMFSIFSQPYSDHYDDKINLLLDKRIALWDVLQYCERDGSEDRKIIDEVPNDFAKFFAKHPSIKSVFFNGNNAHDYYTQFKLPTSTLSLMPPLPSSSPSNTWQGLDEKVISWKSILNALK